MKTNSRSKARRIQPEKGLLLGNRLDLYPHFHILLNISSRKKIVISIHYKLYTIILFVFLVILLSGTKEYTLVKWEFVSRLLNRWFSPNRCPSPQAGNGPETWPHMPDSTRTSVRWITDYKCSMLLYTLPVVSCASANIQLSTLHFLPFELCRSGLQTQEQ